MLFLQNTNENENIFKKKKNNYLWLKKSSLRNSME